MKHRCRKNNFCPPRVLPFLLSARIRIIDQKRNIILYDDRNKLIIDIKSELTQQIKFSSFLPVKLNRLIMRFDRIIGLWEMIYTCYLLGVDLHQRHYDSSIGNAVIPMCMSITSTYRN